MTEQAAELPLSDHAVPQLLPVHAMLLLALAAFVTLLTEIMPAGLLSAISDGLRVSQPVGGQFITAFALGALFAALPSAAFTHRMARKKLLLSGLVGFAVVNFGNAFVSNFTLSLIIRFLAGCCGGLIWAMFAGYATRLAPKGQKGRAIAMAGSGVTLALVLGAPLSAFLGQMIGWRGAFAALGGLSTLLVLWSALILPDVPGTDDDFEFSVLKTLRLPGVGATLVLIFGFVTAHSLLYVYIEPLMVPSSLNTRIDALLLLFGGASVIGLFITGALIDRHMASLFMAGIALFALANMILGTGLGHPLFIIVAITLWGLAMGGFAALTQNAMAHVSGSSLDAAQAMATTSWNLAVSFGGLLGGAILTHATITALPLTAIALLLLGLIAFVRGLRPQIV
ncbi:MFS transporter [Asaia astilbis]|uniref:MFS transporter n=1 Tax=Asaia astilbis TaxID=610244 RepID=UPI000470A629|nr:MFS transporter [Asaia astilbis]